MNGSEAHRKRQVILVTGAARGIGRAIADRLAGGEHQLALNDLDADGLDRAVVQLKKAGAQVLGLPGDVSKPETAAEMVERVMAKFGRIDSLVNNAGIGGVGKTILELTLDEWDEMLRVDLTSTFLLCRAVLPHMMSQQRGRLVNISSVTALRGVAGSPHYAAAKAGVIGFSKSLAREVAGSRINVNVIAPGLIDTAMSRKRGIDHQRHMVAWPRIGQPEDVAGVTAFLLSGEAEFITGQVLSPNGGAYM
jgi:3-oxoacyl-[acyl-carrier protein] reductase